MADIDQFVTQQSRAAQAQADAEAREAELDRRRVAQQQAVQSQNQGSWYGTLLDNLWTDDFAAIPVVGSASSSVAGAVTAGYDNVSAATSWTQSALPGGLDTFTWDQARAISPGQAGVADAAARRTQGGLLNNLTAGVQQFAMGGLTGLGTTAQEQWIPDLNNPEFDVTDEEQRNAAFTEGYGRVLSGTVDAAAMWFLDPLVVAGKASKVARFGSESLQSIPGVGNLTMGFTNMQMGTARAERWAAEKTDEAIAFIDGVPGVSRNVLNEQAAFIAGNTGEAITNHVMFRNNTYRQELVAIADQIDNERDALVFLGAAMGNPKYVKALHEEQLAAADVLDRARNVNNYEQLYINTSVSDVPAVLPNTLEPYVDAQMLLDDLAKRDEWLRAAIGEGGFEGHGILKTMGVREGGTGMITDLGNRSKTLTAVGNAWVEGKAARASRVAAKQDRAYFGLSDLDDIKLPDEAIGVTDQQGGIFDVNDFIDRGYLTAEDAAKLQRREALKDTTGPAAYEKIYELSAGFRKVKVWSWLTGEHASGYMTVRGIDLGTSDRELAAVLNDGKFDPVFATEMKELWGDAVRSGAPEARMRAVKEIEERAAEYFARQTGADTGAMREIYEHISNRRDQVTLGTGNKSLFGIDPDTGFLIAQDPVFRSQLETRVPMMDMRLLRKSAEIAARPEYRGLKTLQATEAGKNLLDQVSMLWKASVLLRLGYTQRNVVEGWLRSAAVLGTVPAITHSPTALKRIVWSNRGWSAAGQVRTKLKYEHSVVEQNLKATREQRAFTEAQLADEEAQWAGIIDMDGAEAFTMQRTNYLADIDALRGEETRLVQEMIDYDALMVAVGKRRLGDDGAFHGVNGDVFRDLASSRATNERVLDSNWGRQTARRMQESNYVKVRPESAQYYDELAVSIDQMRRDPLGQMAIQGKSIEDMARWLNSPAASSYRRTMELADEDIPGKAALVHGMVHNYLPTENARMLAAAHIDDFDIPGPRPDELKAVLQGEAPGVLQPIHGREVKGALNPNPNVMDAVNKPINWLFKWIGTLPESRLVRQPFYNEVWNRRITQQRNLVASRLEKGEEISDEAIKMLEVDAHTFALKATEDTLYTIQRLSNPAAALRFVAPFYPAWENSMKVWAGIILKDPSVAARASMLWQVPNKLGMVVDENGEPINSDPFGFGTGSIDRYITLPKPLNDIFMNFSGGVPFKVAQNSFNVVTPGSTAWLPGMGPMVTAPVGMVLESKPDTQKFLRDLLGDAVYQQAVPFGIASGDLTDTVLPAAARRAYQGWQGESNQEYLAVVDAMMQTAMVDWYASGGDPADKPDMDVVRQKANDFYKFTALSALTLPVTLTRISKYQTQIDYWNNLRAQPGLTYQQKVDQFLTKWGESYAPLLVSASQSEASNIDPTIETWNTLNDNKGLVEKLSQLDPEAIGILGISAPLGQFDQGVYEAYLTSDIPGQPGTQWKSRVAPQEMQNKIELNSAWRDFFNAKARRDQALADRGGMSLDAKANADIAAQWRDFTDNWMVAKYGATWSVAYNDYQQKAAVYLEGVNAALRDPGFMASDTGRSPLWATIRQYMDTRARAIAAIDAGEDSKLVSDQFNAWAAEVRFTSLEFADFFDQYLANDKLSIGVT